MSTGIRQSWGDVRSRARQAIPGMALLLLLSATLINDDPQAVQIRTYTVDTATNGATYDLEINGQAISVVAASGVDTAIASQLAAAINAEPLAGAVCVAVASGADIVCTGRTPGLAWAATESDAKLSVAATQEAASADPVAFGVAIKDTGYNGAEPERTGALAKGFTAQVATLDYTYQSGSTLGARIYEVRGAERHLLADAQVAQATSKNASTTALVDQLNAALPADSVLAANAGASGYELTLTAEVAGLEIAVEVYSDDHAGSAPSVAATTGPSQATSLGRAFAGVSLYDAASEAPSVGAGAGQYAANAGMVVGFEGDIWVASSETPAQGGTVYVDVSTGLFYATAGASRVALSRDTARWLRAGRTGDAIALLHVSA